MSEQLSLPENPTEGLAAGRFVKDLENMLHMGILMGLNPEDAAQILESRAKQLRSDVTRLEAGE